MKIAFFPFLSQPGPTFFGLKKAQIWNSLNIILIFYPLEKTEAILLPSM